MTVGVVGKHGWAALHRWRPTGFWGGLAVVRALWEARDEIARLYDVHPHDLGFHVATADTELLGRGLVSGLLRELADGMFVADPACRRVAAEPASNNAPIRRALTKRGWRDVGEFQVRPERRIALHLLERPSS